MEHDGLIAIGTVRTAWGVKGWLKLSSFSGDWEHFAALETLFLRHKSRSGVTRYQVEGFRMHHGGGLVKIAGVDSLEAGKTLAGSEILVPEDSASPCEEDEWYLKDLVGLSLVDESGRYLGRIVSMIEAADDLLEVKRSGGDTFLVPFRSQFVREPNLEEGTLVLMAGWLAEDS